MAVEEISDIKVIEERSKLIKKLGIIRGSISFSEASMSLDYIEDCAIDLLNNAKIDSKDANKALLEYLKLFLNSQ